MSELDRLLEELERVIVRALRAAEAGDGTAVAEETLDLNGMFTTRFSARVRFLDELGPGPVAGMRPSHDPVIDVFEDGKDLKILVHLPGVKKEDIVLMAGPRSLRISITKDGMKFSRDIPCGSSLSRVRIKSSVENNSVVEITLHEPPGGHSG